MIKKVTFFFLLTLCLIGCQNSKSKHSETQKPSAKEKHKEESEPKLDTSSLAGGPGVRPDTIKTIGQKELKPFLKKYGKANPETHIRISTDFGDIEVELFEDTPLHRANFIRLTKLGYFKTTYFHRVVENFVIQGGNSDERITKRMRNAIGPYLIPSEFSKGHLHDYGAFAAAKQLEQNVSKASSPFEFYIVLNENGAHHLDFEHTVFGKVTKGMDVAEKIGKVKTDEGEWPLDNVEMEVEIMD